MAEPGKYDEISVKAEGGVSQAELTDRISAALPSGTEAVTGAEYLRDGQTHVDPLTLVAPEASYRIRACARFAVGEEIKA